MGFRDEIGLVVRIGPVVGIGLFGGTGLVVSLTDISDFMKHLGNSETFDSFLFCFNYVAFLSFERMSQKTST